MKAILVSLMAPSMIPASREALSAQLIFYQREKASFELAYPRKHIECLKDLSQRYEIVYIGAARLLPLYY